MNKYDKLHSDKGGSIMNKYDKLHSGKWIKSITAKDKHSVEVVVLTESGKTVTYIVNRQPSIGCINNQPHPSH